MSEYAIYPLIGLAVILVIVNRACIVDHLWRVACCFLLVIVLISILVIYIIQQNQDSLEAIVNTVTKAEALFNSTTNTL